MTCDYCWIVCQWTKSQSRAAIGAAFAELGGTGRDARSLFAPNSWWSMKHASARWGDYVASAGRHGARDLSVVIASVSAKAQNNTGALTMSGRMGEQFLQQITTDADDDALRLVFSDWLENAASWIGRSSFACKYKERVCRHGMPLRSA